MMRSVHGLALAALFGLALSGAVAAAPLDAPSQNDSVAASTLASAPLARDNAGDSKKADSKKAGDKKADREMTDTARASSAPASAEKPVDSPAAAKTPEATPVTEMPVAVTPGAEKTVASTSPAAAPTADVKGAAAPVDNANVADNKATEQKVTEHKTGATKTDATETAKIVLPEVAPSGPTATVAVADPVARSAHATGAANDKKSGVFWALQLGSFQTSTSAQSEIPRLRDRYPDLFVGHAMVIEAASAGGNGSILRLVGGHFADTALAHAACKRLMGQNDGCVVLRRDPAVARPLAATLPATTVAATTVPEATKTEEAAALDKAARTAPAAGGTAAMASSLEATISVQSKPAQAEPARIEPAKAESAKVAPAKVEPAKAEPAKVESAKVEPAKVEPAKVELAIARAPTAVAATQPPTTLVAVQSSPKVRVLRQPPEPKPEPSRMATVPPRMPISLELDKGTLLRLPRPAETVFVADPKIADVQVKSPSMIYVYGKHVGETVLYAVDRNDGVLINAKVTVNHNLSALRKALAGLVPNDSVHVTSVDNSLVLSGHVPTAAMAENVRRLAARFAPEKDAVINQLQVTAPNQVNLRVRVAEMSRTTLKNFGINIDAMLSIGNFAFGVATGNPAIAAAGSFLTRSTIAGANASNNNLFGSFRSNGVSINGLIDALGAEGMITVLAEPNLTAVSGETASFLAGGEFPIPVPQANNVVTIEFKKFGVGLSFTPTILDNNRINLRVRPEVSQLSTVGAVQINNFTIPALTTRRADTTVELGSGQSFAIAGLLQNNSQQDISQLPMLGDIPVLGALFRSDRFRRNETELVIIVTPYVVRPVSAKQMASPLDGLVPPNDVERIFGGATYRQQITKLDGAPVGRDGQGLIGPAGFVLE